MENMRLGGKVKALQGKSENKSRLWSRKSLTNREGTMRSRHGRLGGRGQVGCVITTVAKAAANVGNKGGR